MAMAGDGPTFAELVERARRGEPDAARALVERYGDAVRRQVRFSLMDNRLRRVVDETDVCQSVLGQFFIGLWAGRFELEGPEQLVRLLKEMVRNKIIDQARYWGAARRDQGRNVEAIDPDDRAADFPSPGPTPSQVVADAELLAEFERRLTDKERAVLARRRQGASWAEVAGDLGDSAEALRKRFERAVERVSRELGLED